jgi:NifU-like protein involved in Fe-S cluster formation
MAARSLFRRTIRAYLWKPKADAKGRPMSGDGDMIKLYSQRILALAADIPLTERLDKPQVTARKRSPLCGSTVTVDLGLENGRVSAFGQDVKACALGQASAAILGQNVIGRTREEVARAREQLAAMLKSGGPAPDAPFDAFEVLMPARDYKNRHASIMLALDATLAAFDEAVQAA